MEAAKNFVDYMEQKDQINLNVPSADINLSTALVNQIKRQIEEYNDQYFQKVAQKNPNIVLDHNQYMRAALIDILTNQRGLI